MKISEKLTIILGIALFGLFVIGLAWSISTGLAGFWRGLPFWFIVVFCLLLLVIDSLKQIHDQTYLIANLTLSKISNVPVNDNEIKDTVDQLQPKVME